jgi:exportin-1
MISRAFPHLNSTQVDTFILGLFDLNKGSQETFKAHLRDFLISLKEFSEGDNSELYLEEKELEMERKRQAEIEQAMKVPGLIRPSERNDDSDNQA